MVRKNKLYKHHKSKASFYIRNFSFAFALFLGLGTAVTVPTYIASRNTEQVIRLQNILKGMGVFEELKKYGLKNGDVVILGGLELAYYDDEFWGDEVKG